MIRNNQNGRRRGRGGARPPQGGGPSGNYGNNNGGGSRIDTRQRGNATQLLEKYKAMARDATQNGDRVQAEFYMQYADHYFRVLNEFRARDPQPAPRPTYDDDDDGFGASGVGQNYAAATERYDDDGDEPSERGAERGGGGSERNDRQPYRAGGDRPRGNDGHAMQGDRSLRDNRDGGRQPGYTARNGNGGDDGRNDNGRSEPVRSGDGRGDAARRDDGPVDAPRYEGRGDAGQNGDAGRNGDTPRRENSADGSRSGGDFAPRQRAPRYAAAPEAMTGLPGPATLAPTFAAPPPPEPASVAAAAPPAAGDAEAPVRRPRGRPRKVVVTDSVDG